VGAGASIGAGAVLTEDVPDDALALARAPQVTRPGAAARLRRRLAERKAGRDAAE
ncbi:MAG: bifunctional UDP-N-acetylglucosamine diphosphorylase/glucosamine-1-phosphate N-acetyltransferase GlmU, partial [Pseudomonadota bacterium]